MALHDHAMGHKHAIQPLPRHAPGSIDGAAEDEEADEEDRDAAKGSLNWRGSKSKSTPSSRWMRSKVAASVSV